MAPLQPENARPNRGHFHARCLMKGRRRPLIGCLRLMDWLPLACSFTEYRSNDTIVKETRTSAHPCADVAQLVEQLIRNQQVIGSSPIVGSMHRDSPSSNPGPQTPQNLRHRSLALRAIRRMPRDKNTRCHSERTGPRTCFSSGVVSEESASFGFLICAAYSSSRDIAVKRRVPHS
jgi:hypothetical protein